MLRIFFYMDNTFTDHFMNHWIFENLPNIFMANIDSAGQKRNDTYMHRNTDKTLQKKKSFIVYLFFIIHKQCLQIYNL